MLWLLAAAVLILIYGITAVYLYYGYKHNLIL